MPTIEVNGVRLFYALTGDAGPPLVLVHGSWGDHHGWDSVVPALAPRFRVLAYDRRGHSQSERPLGQGSVDEDAHDLATLIEQLDLAPAHVAGISFGGSIALRLATQRPDLFRSLAVQEPPLFALLADEPDLAPVVQEMQTHIGTVIERLAAGDVTEGTRRFMETIAFGQGAWERLSPAEQVRLIANAPTFLDETRDPTALTVDLTALAAFSHPTLLSYGDQSAPFFPPVIAKLARVMPHAVVRVFAGAGHVVIDTHPAEYVAVLTAFAEAADAATA